jgi:transposase
MGEESCIYEYGYDPEIKQQSLKWKRPQLPRGIKARQVRSSTKSMFIVFFDVKRTVHREFVPPKTTVNSDFYCDVLRHLRENLRRRKLELWHNHNWLLHHDNGPAYTSLKTTEYVTNNNMVIVPHPPYSPDLVHCDFCLFPKLKMKLKKLRSETVSDIQRESQAVLYSIEENDSHGAFEAWKNRRDRCMRSKGEYFGGAGSQN